MPDPVPDPSDFLRAHDVCAWLSNNYKIQFQIEGIEMPREQAVKHFKRREALADRSNHAPRFDGGARSTPPMETEMTARFHRRRWSPTVGKELHLPNEQRDTAHGTVDRFNDAYAGAHVWKLSLANGQVIVRRIS